MTDEDLRALVRGAVERHLVAAGGMPAPALVPVTPAPVPTFARHPGFFRYTLPSGRESDGPCLIEPAVRCNHCGFCQSHGY